MCAPFIKETCICTLRKYTKIWRKVPVKKKSSKNNQSVIKPFVKKNIKMQSIVISLKKQLIYNKKYKNFDEIKNGFCGISKK